MISATTTHVNMWRKRHCAVSSEFLVDVEFSLQKCGRLDFRTDLKFVLGAVLAVLFWGCSDRGFGAVPGLFWRGILGGSGVAWV